LPHQENIKKSSKKNQGGCVRNMELKIGLSNGGYGAERFVASRFSGHLINASSSNGVTYSPAYERNPKVD